MALLLISRRLGAALAALILCLSSAQSADAREPLDSSHPPFSALGRVNAGGASFCSGVLIGPETALTAAHCLYNAKTKRWWPPEDIHFVAGYWRDSWVAAAKAKRIRRDPTFTPQDRHPHLSEIGRDWAVIELDAPIGRTAGWFPLIRAPRLDEGALALQAGYRRDRAFAPELSPPCRIVGQDQESGTVFQDCLVPEGGSGSPLFVLDKGVLGVAGIHSAQIRNAHGDPLAALVPVSRFEDKIPAQPPPPDADSGAQAAARILARRAGLAEPKNGSGLDALMHKLYRGDAR